MHWEAFNAQNVAQIVIKMNLDKKDVKIVDQDIIIRTMEAPRLLTANRVPHFALLVMVLQTQNVERAI